MPRTRAKLKKSALPSLDALRLEAAMFFSVLPKPSFAYGLNVFFAADAIPMPEDSGDAEPPCEVHAPEGVEVMPLSIAMADARFAAAIRERLAVAAGDRIDAWLLASLHEGTFIRVPAGFRAPAPVRLDLLMRRIRRADLVVVLAEEGSDVTLVEHLASGPVRAHALGTAPKGSHGDPRIRASRTEIIAQDGAHVTHVSVQDFGADITSYDRKGALVGRDASVRWTECAFGAGFMRSRISSVLAAPGASAHVLGMSFIGDAQKYDQRHEVRHLASRTTSDIATRVAVGGTAKAIYRSLVNIAPKTEGCSGEQREDTLLLAPRAEIDAMPDLEIGTGDVCARHSASAGRLNAEKLFFLESRGLSRAQAKAMLIEAFFAPVVAAMHEAGMQDMVECLIAARLESRDAAPVAAPADTVAVAAEAEAKAFA
jgi:Fe-S cluster assembly scaffold protein SufB